MSGTNLPTDLRSWMNLMERRIKDLETAPRVRRTGQRGGTFKLLNEAGTESYVDFGAETDGAGTDTFGVMLRDGDGIVQAITDDQRGQMYPAFNQSPFIGQQQKTSQTTSSASYVRMWKNGLFHVPVEAVKFEFTVNMPAGAVGTVRCGEESTGATTNAVSADNSGGGGATDFVCTCAWETLMQASWGGTDYTVGGAGQFWRFYIEVLLASGSGPVTVYEPDYFIAGSDAFLSANVAASALSIV